MEWLGIEKDVAAATYEALLPAFNDDGNCPEDGMRLVIEEAKKVAKANRDVPVDRVVDLQDSRGGSKRARDQRKLDLITG